ncbi:MAG: hypothetical protein J7J07_04370 [Syntrophobacterales bacterium]|nr:hypothetical protein [Syntrophobacterales bacterium]
MLEIKTIRHHITTAIVAIFFCISAYSFLTVHNNYALRNEKLKALTGEARLLEHNQGEINRKKVLMNRVGTFVNLAVSSGLEKSKWAFYDVDIEDIFTFPEAERIISQTASTASYYFKPVMLHMKTDMESYKETIKDKTFRGKSADSKLKRQGDVLLKLKGTFVVRRK